MGGYTYVSPEQKARNKVREATDLQKRKLLQTRADEMTEAAKADAISRILVAKGKRVTLQWTLGGPTEVGPHWLLFGDGTARMVWVARKFQFPGMIAHHKLPLPPCREVTASITSEGRAFSSSAKHDWERFSGWNVLDKIREHVEVDWEKTTVKKMGRLIAAERKRTSGELVKATSTR